MASRTCAPSPVAIRCAVTSTRSPRTVANTRIESGKSHEIASTRLKLTPENGARAFSHSLHPKRSDGLLVCRHSQGAKQTTRLLIASSISKWSGSSEHVGTQHSQHNQ